MSLLRQCNPFTSSSSSNGTTITLFRTSCTPSTHSSLSRAKRIASSHLHAPTSNGNKSSTHNHTQIRHATFVPRPRRPYTFTQLATLSDGSTFLHRTTNPQPVFKSTKDTRNTQLWNPSSQRLMNVEADEAGRLRAFRSRFGRGWDTKRGKEIQLDSEGVEVVEAGEIDAGADAEAASTTTAVADAVPGDGKTIAATKEPAPATAAATEENTDEDNLLDLISNPEYGTGVQLGPKEVKKRKKAKK